MTDLWSHLNYLAVTAWQQHFNFSPFKTNSRATHTNKATLNKHLSSLKHKIHSQALFDNPVYSSPYDMIRVNETFLPHVLHNLSKLQSKALNWGSFYCWSSVKREPRGWCLRVRSLKCKLKLKSPLSNPDLRSPSDQTSQADLISRASDLLWPWRQTTREDVTCDLSLCF